MSESELCNSKSHFSSHAISDLVLLCSSILSHPLYLSYFIFFAPYLLKLIYFLSPLFITTFLVFLAFLTGFVHESFSAELAQTKVSHLLSGYNSVLEKLRFKNDEFQCWDDLGMYEILFGPSVRENPVEFSEEKSVEDPLQSWNQEDLSPAVDKVEKNPIPDAKSENSGSGMEEKRLENFLRILGEFERMSSNVEERKKFEQPSRGAKAEKVGEKPKAGPLSTNGSEAKANKINDAAAAAANGGGKEYSKSAHSQRITSNADHDHADEEEDGRWGKSTLRAESSRELDVNSLGSYGSMRKEKEWKRTLACKLFEERHNVDGGEGMDSLWEAYEMDSDKQKSDERKDKKEKKQKKKKKGGDIRLQEKKSYGNEEEEEIDGQLCCLQALKLSAGKMNLGMGRPNLLKISKAIKGFGWLHNVSKHSKKVHDDGDRY